jgi:C-terminal processing protease CtpA/Prc
MDGYGQDYVVAGDALQVYETTAVSCRPGQHGTQSSPGRFEVPDDDAITIRLVGRATAVVHVDSATSRRFLHRMAALPAQCGRPSATDALTTFDVFWSTFAENYPFFALHGVDWTAMRDRYRPTITDDRSLYSAIKQMLTPLQDAHVGVFGPDPAPFHVSRPSTIEPSDDLNNALLGMVRRVDLPGVGVPAGLLTTHADGRIAFAELPGRIGYLRVAGFTGYTDADDEPSNRGVLEQALKVVFGHPSWRGLMIDLRINGGGSDQLAIELARRLTGQPYLAYLKQYQRRAGQWSAPQPVLVRPAASTYRGPIALLTSGSTVSAGESFTEAMLARRPRPVLIGEPTQGVFSDELERTLPNGWRFALPNERYVTPSGESFDGRGIPPDVAEPLVISGPRDPLFAAAYRVARGELPT